MNAMSTADLTTGRVAQKQRTYDALVAAARELLADGVTPSLDEVARLARVSRPTAYRYFGSRDELLLAAHPEVERRSLLPSPAPTDVRERLGAVVADFVKLIDETEPQQRAMLRAALDGATRDELPLRQGRAIRWIAEALEPLTPRLGAERVHSLALAIRSAIGIEARVWLSDVAGLSAGQIAQLMTWTASAMLDAAMADQAPPPMAPAP
jgi:AcrR family transcriptional regulator